MDREHIGERGQWMFSLLMTELGERDRPLFRPRFLGEKYPTFDFIVELVDHPQYYFFVQVKTTTLGYTTDLRRLKVNVSQADINRMVASPAPSYVVGIDMPNRIGYLVSINEPQDQIASLTTRFKLDNPVLQGLASEVYQFWSSRDMVLRESQFKETR